MSYVNHSYVSEEQRIYLSTDTLMMCTAYKTLYGSKLRENTCKIKKKYLGILSSDITIEYYRTPESRSNIHISKISHGLPVSSFLLSQLAYIISAKRQLFCCADCKPCSRNTIQRLPKGQSVRRRLSQNI